MMTKAKSQTETKGDENRAGRIKWENKECILSDLWWRANYYGQDIRCPFISKWRKKRETTTDAL